MDEQTVPLPDERPLTFGQRLVQGRNIVAALPGLLFALLYFLGAYKKLTFFGMTPVMLKRMMAIEFLVIHSFPFLVFFAIFPVIAEKQRRNFQWIFWGMLCFYLIMAFSLGRFWGVVVFAGLTFSTYFGFFFRMFTAQAMIELAVRWGANFAAFMLGDIFFRLPKNVRSWIYEEETLYFGMVYFLVLTCLEWFGVYQAAWIGKVAAAIKRAKTQMGRKD